MAALGSLLFSLQDGGFVQAFDFGRLRGEAAGDRGLRSPLSPTTPYPALGQPSLSACMIALDVLLPPLCRAAYGNALPLSRLRRNERPGGVGASAPTGGDLLRAMPRLRFRSRMMGTGRHDER